MTTISQALNGALAMITHGQTIYREVAKFMDAIEVSGGNGLSKKDWVMAAAKNLILTEGKVWDKWKQYISDFIDSAKSFYNSVKGVFR